jgi:hypothetical protein
MICADDSGGKSCPAPVMCMPRRRTTLVMIATKPSRRVIFIGLSLRRSDRLSIPGMSTARGIAGYGKLDPDISFKKLGAMVEGAAIASKRLWGRA